MDKRLLKVLKHDYAVEMDKKRNLKAIRTLYDMNEKEEYHIDEQTWNDLDLDKVYSKLDRNYSSLGEASLYSMLRNPLNDEKKLNKRREEIEYFKENEEVRFKIMWIFFELGRDKKNSLLDMINEKLIESNKFKYYFYTITGKILALILILTAIFVSVSAMLGLMAVTFVNIYINSKERDLYKTLGEMEAIISIGSYEEEKKDNITRPKFIRETTLEIKNGIHPIIENPVANSINMSKRGIVLTGTNMSGKSTFLRMLGVNMLFAQAFNFVLAEKYEGPIFNIVTSISPNDDLSVGKSFYMAEAESILRIIRALDKELPVFCAIDEIFRGTNPIERISASAEILTYINNKNSISIVATHDRELVDILKESYEFYYFSENVDSKNGLSFDYKLKRGVSKTRNAIKLLEYIGYPKDIINKSYRRSEKLEGFI